MTDTNSEKFDAIIIGTGQAGPALAARMHDEGMRVAVIERKSIGGTCVNVGCTPTKALVASARAAHMARRASDFGVVLDGEVSVDMKRVKARMKEIVGQSTAGLTNWLGGMDNVTFIQGHGRLESANTVVVGERLLQADKIFLNVGARARVPDMPGLDEIDFLTNTSIMEVDFVPEHLIVVGASYIGLELSQIYRRFGSKVTVVEMAPRVIGRDDEDVSATVKEILGKEGVAFRLGAKCVTVHKRGDGVAIDVSCEEGEPEIVARTCSWRRGASPTRTMSVRPPRASSSTIEASWSWTTISEPTCPGFGRWATATAKGRSHTPPTTTTRSPRPTCSMTILEK
jgi:pyruvate/2-oxoglutarate dehydrogenase complex dihydrolipoamide dehydrogenase (E3) component